MDQTWHVPGRRASDVIFLPCRDDQEAKDAAQCLQPSLSKCKPTPFPVQWNVGVFIGISLVCKDEPSEWMNKQMCGRMHVLRIGQWRWQPLIVIQSEGLGLTPASDSSTITYLWNSKRVFKVIWGVSDFSCSWYYRLCGWYKDYIRQSTNNS